MARLEAGGGGTTSKGQQLLQQAYEQGKVNPVKHPQGTTYIPGYGTVSNQQVASGNFYGNQVSQSSNGNYYVDNTPVAETIAEAQPELPEYQRILLPTSGRTLPKGYYPQQYKAPYLGSTVKDLNIAYNRTLVNNKTVRDYEADLKNREQELKALSVNISNASNETIQNYNAKVKEYEREYQKYVQAVEDANDAAASYQDAMSNYHLGSTDGMVQGVKNDYATMQTASDRARRQAADDTRRQLESQKKSLEAQRDSVSYNTQRAINRGSSNSANIGTSLIRQYDSQIAEIDKSLASLGDWEAAYSMEDQAKADPNFQKFAEEGAQKLEDNLETIAKAGGDMSWYNDYLAMTEEQRAVYAYYYAKTGGESKSVEYKDKIQREINEKVTKQYLERVQRESEANPVGAGIASVLMTPYATAMTTADMLANLANPQDFSQAADPNTRGSRMQQGVQAARQAGLDNISNPILKTLAESGYAIADMAPALAANAVMPGLGTAYMGLLGGASGYTDAAGRGLSNKQALTYGAVSGAVSTALEKIGLDKIGEAFAGGKKPATQLIRQVLGSFMAEGSEEAAENLAQVIYDETISGSNSAINQAIRQYMADGMNRKEAEARAWKDFGADTLQTFIVGGLSGGVMSGAAGIVNNAVNSNVSKQLQDLGLSEQEAQTLINSQRPAREYSVADDNSVEKRAVDTFGTTNNWNEAAYITTNGDVLDFSGKNDGGPAGTRTIDHRDIWDAYDANEAPGTGAEALVDFMSRGNVRVMPENGGINLSVKPNRQQESALRDFIDSNGGEVVLDIDNTSGKTVVSVEYNKGTSASKILSDIRNYFDNGEQPKTTDGVGRYRYSAGETNGRAGAADEITQLSSDIGVTTVFDDSLPDNVNGYYDRETGEIHINPNADASTVFSHELTHSLENTEAYQKLKDLVINQLGDEVETLRQQKSDLYNRLGKDLDVDSELVADYVSQNLFTDAESIRRVAEADRSLATRIKNWITRMIAKVTGNSEKAFLMRAEGLYNQALNQSGVNTMSLDSRAYSASENSDVQKLEQQNAELRRQLTRTTVNEPNPTQVKSAAKQFLDGYSSRYSSDSLVNDLNELYVMMGNRTIEQDGRINETGYEMMHEKALQIADNIIQNSEVVNQTEEYSHLKSILKDNPVYVDPDIRSDIEEGYSNFRKKHQNEMSFSQEGMSVDQLWQVLNEEFPGLFPEDVNEGDMLNILGDILDSMKPTRSNPFTTGNADLTFEKENLATALMERFFSIPQRAPTFADKQAAKLVRAKIDARKAVDAAVADQRQKRENLRQRKNERIDELERRAADKVKKVRADEKASKWETVDKRVADQREKRERLRLKKNERIDTVERRGAEKVKTVRAEEKAAKQEAVNKAVADQRQKREALRLRKNERIDVVTKRGAEKVKKVRAEEKAAKHEAIDKLTAANREARETSRDNRNRRQTRERISDHVKALSKKLLNPTNTSHIPDELTKPVASLLEAVNMESAFSNVLTEDGKLKRVGATEGEPTKRTQAFRELREAYTAIQQNPRWANSMVVDPDLQANIDAVIAMKDIPIMSMNQQQLNTVWEAVAAVEHSIGTINRAFAEGRYATISGEAEAIMRGLEHQKTKTQRRGFRGKAGQLFNVEMLNPYDYFHEMGEGGDAQYRKLRAAEDVQVRDYVDIQRFVQNTVESKDINKWRKMRAQQIRVEGGTISLTVPQKMSLYLLNKREQARKHIYGGGIKQGRVATRGSKLQGSTKRVKVTEADVDRIVNTLTPEQKKVADALSWYMTNIMAGWGNETSMKLYGYQKFTDPNYIPITVDTNYTERNISESSGQGSIENKGMTKAVNENASNPLIVDDLFAVFAKHGSEMTAYHAWLPALKDAERVYNFRGPDYTGSVSEEIERVMGSGGPTYFRNLVQDINGRANLRNDFDTSGFISNYKRAAVGANLRVIIQQPTAYFRALAVIDPVSLSKGVFTPKKWELVKQWAPIAQWKDWGYFEINTGRQLEDVILGTDTKFERFQQGLMAAAGKADEITWTRLWSSCEHYVKTHFKGVRVGSDEFYLKVADKFNELIDRTQVVDSVLHRSQIMRSTNGLNKIATSFMGEPTKSYNLLRTALRDITSAAPGQRGAAVKRASAALIAFTLSGTVNAAAAAIVDALRDDDKDEEYLDKWWQAFTGIQGDEETIQDLLKNLISGNMADNLNVMNLIPYLKDVISLLQGYDVERMDMSSIADLIQAGENLVKSLSGEGTKSMLKTSGDFLLQAAKMLGVPAANLARDIGAVVDTVIRGIDNPVITYHYDQLEAPLMKNKGVYYDLLWDTVKDGDQAAYQAIRDDMMEQGITLEDVRGALRDRYKAEWQTDHSIENDPWMMKEAGVSKENIAEWKKNEFKKRWEEDPSIADDAQAMADAGVTRDEIVKWQESAWKSGGYVDTLKSMGADINVVESTMKAIRSAEKVADKRALLREANLPDNQKAILYRTFATGKDADIIDQFMENEWDLGDCYNALDAIADKSRIQEKLKALSGVSIPDNELLYVLSNKVLDEGRIEDMMGILQSGVSVRSYMSVYDAYLTIKNIEEATAPEQATELAKWLDQQNFTAEQKALLKDEFSYYSMIRAEATKYESFVGAGLSYEEAGALEQIINGLEPEEGKDAVSVTQKALAVASANLDDTKKLAALSVVMPDETYARVQTAWSNGISPGTFVTYWSNIKNISADKDEEGKSIAGTKKAKVMTYIDSLNLTVDQKNVLYEDAGYKMSTIDEAPWYGGESYDGELFDEPEQAAPQTVEPVENIAEHVTQSYGGEHTGVDIGWNVSPTQDIMSYTGGTVIYTQTGYGNAIGSTGMDSYGNMVQIQYDDGTTGLFAHLSNVDVKEGDRVEAGQKIGNMGNSGNASGNHLHYEMTDANGNRMDPIAYMNGGSVLGGSDTGSGGSSGSKGSSSKGSSSKGSSGKKGSSSKGSSSGSSKKPKKLSPISLSAPRATSWDLPEAKTITSSNVMKLSLPTVRTISKAALTSNNTGITVPEVGGITSRNSRSSNVKFIKL